MNQIYEYDVAMAPEMVDGDGHVNNVAYIQRAQEVARAGETEAKNGRLGEASLPKTRR